MRRGTTFTFVSAGFETAVKRARQAAGDHDVSLHGATPIQEALSAGVLDELQLHVVPVPLGPGGRRLFEHIDSAPLALEPIRVLDHPGVTHIKYRARTT